MIRFLTFGKLESDGVSTFKAFFDVFVIEAIRPCVTHLARFTNMRDFSSRVISYVVICPLSPCDQSDAKWVAAMGLYAGSVAANPKFSRVAFRKALFRYL